MSPAPIILFVYNRPSHTKKTLDALRENKMAGDSILYVFADGPKHNADDTERKAINETRELIKTIRGFKEVIIQTSDKNKGLANSVINGVTAVVNKHGSVIVLEDDMITSPFFLTYMNKALGIYEKEEKVISISAYIYPAKNLPPYFFMKGADCWGWATWKRGWDLFEPDAEKMLRELEHKNLVSEFDFNNTYPYTKMLRDQVFGKVDSWAIRWYSSSFLKEKLTLYPGKTLLQNIGLEGSGTHKSSTHKMKSLIDNHPPDKLMQLKPEEDKTSKEKISRYFIELVKPAKKSVNFNAHSLRIIKQFIPPAFFYLKRRITKPPVNAPSAPSAFSGNYGTWEEAKRETTGYDNSSILEKVKEAVLKVKNREAVFERDSVVFDKPEYTWPLLAVLQKIYIENSSALHVLDFGGSLGSTYFQNKNFLGGIKNLTWDVVEQSHYVEAGKKYIEENGLHFHNSIEDVLLKGKPHVALLSSVLQYLPNPFEFIEHLINFNFEYILLDRTAFIENERDVITIQNVPKHIYKASYPAWFFNESAFIEKFKNYYNLLYEFESLVTPPMILEGKKVCWKGLIFKKK